MSFVDNLVKNNNKQKNNRKNIFKNDPDKNSLPVDRSLIKYEKGQIWQTKTGMIYYVHEVSPRNKIHSSESERYLTLYIVKPHKKDAQFSNNIVVVEDEPMNIQFDVYLTRAIKITITTMRNVDAYYFGKVNSRVQEIIDKSLAENE